jgi:hypothetical protein
VTTAPITNHARRTSHTHGLRAVDRTAEPVSGKRKRTHKRKPESRHCEVPGCGRTTRERKPWCPEHALSHSPYVLEVKAEVARRGEG